MRLIDADKITFLDCLAKTGNAVCCHAKGIVSKSAIEMQPTVEAIPIEWIDGYIKRRANDAEIYAEILFISDMVKEWEKENE